MKNVIDWEAWEVDEPAPDFVEQVMRKTTSHTAAQSDERRRPISPRATGFLAAASIAVVSLAGLAMVAREARRAGAPSSPASVRSAGKQEGGALPMPDEHAKDVIPTASTVIDRTLRDRVRDRLVPLIESRASERDPHTGLTVPAGSSGPSYELTAEYIEARMREDFFPLARACYESALVRLPALRGRIMLDFVIVGDAKVGGIVDQAAVGEGSEITDPEFVSCVRESMLSMVFAPPSRDGWVTVIYPIAFAPDGEPGKDD